MQASVLLFRWGGYCWACNLSVLIIYFSLPVMLPSVFPRLATDSAGRVFPGVWKPLFLKFPSQDGLPFLGWASLPGMGFPSRDGAPSPPPLSLFFVFYFFLPVFEDNHLLFWVTVVLCQHSEVVLWSLLSI